MPNKPAQQPEVIKPTSVPPTQPDAVKTPSMPSLKDTTPSKPETTNTTPPSGNSTTPPPSGISPSQPTGLNGPTSPFDKFKTLPKNIKIAIGLGLVLFFVMILSLIGSVAVSNPKPQPTPTPPFVNAPTPTSSPTDSWRIYANEKYGFNVKYPHEFTISNQLEDQRFEFSEGIDIKNFNRVNRFTNPNATWIQIETLYTSNEISSLIDWVKTDFPTVNRNGTSSGTLRNILPENIGGNEAVVFEDGVNETRKNVVFYRDRRMIIFTLFPIKESNGSYTENKESGIYLNQMLTTFNFTDISFTPINQNVLFELPVDWKVLEETRDRLYLSNKNASKVIKIFKKTNISSQDMQIEATKKMISDIRDEYSDLIPGNNSSQISGCQKTVGCNRLYSIIIKNSNAYYLFQFENNNNDQAYGSVLKTVTIK